MNSDFLIEHKHYFLIFHMTHQKSASVSEFLSGFLSPDPSKTKEGRAVSKSDFRKIERLLSELPEKERESIVEYYILHAAKRGRSRPLLAALSALRYGSVNEECQSPISAHFLNYVFDNNIDDFSTMTLLSLIELEAVSHASRELNKEVRMIREDAENRAAHELFEILGAEPSAAFVELLSQGAEKSADEARELFSKAMSGDFPLAEWGSPSPKGRCYSDALQFLRLTQRRLAPETLSERKRSRKVL